MAALESELLRRACVALDDDLVELAFCGRDHADSAVWRLATGADGRVVYLKRHRRAGKLAAERAAYRRWIDALDDSPRLLAVLDPEPPSQRGALLLSAVGGDEGDHLDLAPHDAREVHRLAGAWLRRLHDLPHDDDDPLALGDALVQRAHACARRARGLVDDALVDALVERLTDALRDAPLRRVPCHRDYGPRNWMVERHPVRLAVIDFEHTRPDHPLSDFVKLAATDWRARRELGEAFLEGYGRSLASAERALLRALVGLHGLATLSWARRHADAAFERLGREILADVARPL